MSGRMKENRQHWFTKSKSYQSNLIACYKWQDLYMGREHWVSFILASRSKAGLPSGEPKQTGGKSWQEPCEVQQGPQPYPISGKEELLMMSWYRLEMDCCGSALGVLIGSKLCMRWWYDFVPWVAWTGAWLVWGKRLFLLTQNLLDRV